MAQRSREDDSRFVEIKGQYNYGYGDEYFIEDANGKKHTPHDSINLFKKCLIIKRIQEKYSDGAITNASLVKDRMNYAEEEEMRINPVLREGWKIAREEKPELVCAIITNLFCLIFLRLSEL
jgi:hypothetical protein